MISMQHLRALAEAAGYRIDRDGADLVLVNVANNTAVLYGGVTDLYEFLEGK